MTDRRGAAQAALDQLVGPAGCLGAALVSRDGLPVLSRMNRPVQEESFSAMVAAFLGAAEAAWQEWGEDRPQRAFLEGSTLRMAVVGLDGEHILAAAAPVPGDAASFARAVESAAQALRQALRG